MVWRNYYWCIARCGKITIGVWHGMEKLLLVYGMVWRNYCWWDLYDDECELILVRPCVITWSKNWYQQEQ